MEHREVLDVLRDHPLVPRPWPLEAGLHLTALGDHRAPLQRGCRLCGLAALRLPPGSASHREAASLRQQPPFVLPHGQLMVGRLVIGCQFSIDLLRKTLRNSEKAARTCPSVRLSWAAALSTRCSTLPRRPAQQPCDLPDIRPRSQTRSPSARPLAEHDPPDGPPSAIPHRLGAPLLTKLSHALGQHRA